MCILKSHPNQARPRLWLAVLLLVCAILGPSASIGVQDGDMEALQRIGTECARIAEQAYPAVVTIVVKTPVASGDAIRDMLRQRRSRGPLGQGGAPGAPSESRRPRPVVPEEFMGRLIPERVRPFSRGLGIIVSADGWIITNSHIVRDANGVEVELADGRSFQGKVAGADPATNIAVVKIEADHLKTLELGDSDAVALGDWVISIGNPMGIGRSFAVGLITGKHRSGLGMADYEDFIQTDAAPALGDAGGPVLDLHGRVVAMNTAVLGADRDRGIGLATPINMVKAVYDDLASGGPVRRGFLGIQMEDVEAGMAERLGLDEVTGVVIVSVVEASPAAKAGLREDDVIVQLDDEEISSSNQLRLAVAQKSPDTDVDVMVMRDGQRQRLTVTLAERPSAR